jgi:hypothetical protein
VPSQQKLTDGGVSFGRGRGAGRPQSGPEGEDSTVGRRVDQWGYWGALAGADDGRRTTDDGRWTMDEGQWTMDDGGRTRDFPHAKDFGIRNSEFGIRK